MREIKLSSKKLTALFDEIGGEGALEKILVRFYEKMSGDVMIGFFFTGKDIHAIALKQKEFLMRAWGVSPSYRGKAPAEAHAHLPPILRGHFDRRLRILEETLTEFKVSEQSKKLWVEFESTFRDAVEHS
jgi:hemoglobin